MTGAGKTYTMQGTKNNPGIIPRTMEELMRMVKSKNEEASKNQDYFETKVLISFYELYNEKLYDLTSSKNTDLPIREDQNKRIIISNLAETPIESFEEFNQFFETAAKKRSTAPTKLNSHSSRSHAILMIRVISRDDDINSPTYGSLLEGKLHLIDLAGSEDNRKTENVGARIVESSNINTSLFVLAKVINALNDGDKRIPYRDSKLTRLLQDSLGGKAIGILIANVAPGQAHFTNTFNTLNFAFKSKKVVNLPKVNAFHEKSKSEETEMDRRQKLELWRQRKNGKKLTRSSSSYNTLFKLIDEHQDNDQIYIDNRFNKNKIGISDDNNEYIYVNTSRSSAYDSIVKNINQLDLNKENSINIDNPRITKRTGDIIDHYNFKDDLEYKDDLVQCNNENTLSKRKKRSSQLYSPSIEIKVKKAILRELNLLDFSVDEQIKEILDVLNNGNEKEIQTLHGIGKIKAEQIVEYRTQERRNNENFSFDGIENLVRFGLRERAIITFLKRNIIEAMYFKMEKKSVKI